MLREPLRTLRHAAADCELPPPWATVLLSQFGQAWLVAAELDPDGADSSFNWGPGRCAHGAAVPLRMSNWAPDFDATLGRLLAHIDLPPSARCPAFQRPKPACEG